MTSCFKQNSRINLSISNKSCSENQKRKIKILYSLLTYSRAVRCSVLISPSKYLYQHFQEEMTTAAWIPGILCVCIRYTFSCISLNILLVQMQLIFVAISFFYSAMFVIFFSLTTFQGPSDECSSNTYSRVFSSVGQESILSALNEVRRKVAHGQQWGQPPAANMKKIVSMPGQHRLLEGFVLLSRLIKEYRLQTVVFRVGLKNSLIQHRGGQTSACTSMTRVGTCWTIPMWGRILGRQHSLPKKVMMGVRMQMRFVVNIYIESLNEKVV